LRVKIGLNETRIKLRIHSLFSLKRSLNFLKNFCILLLCIAITGYPLTSQAAILTEVQKDYNDSVCSKETSGQTDTHCSSAKSQLLGADVATATASLMAGVVVVCTMGCFGNAAADKACMWLDLGVMVADTIATSVVTKEYTNIASGLGMAVMQVGMMMMMGNNSPKATAGAKGAADSAADTKTKSTGDGANSANDGANSTGDAANSADDAAKSEKTATNAEKTGSKTNMGSCLSLAMALMFIAQKVATAQMAVELAAKEIKAAKELNTQTATTLVASGGDTGNTPNPDTGKYNNIDAVMTKSSQLQLNTTNNRQTAQAEAAQIGAILPSKLTSAPFASGFQELTGQPLDHFLAQSRNDPQASAVAALSTAMPAGEAQKFMSAASDGISKLIAKGYSLNNTAGTIYSGGGGHRGSSGGGSEEDAMAQMLGGLMGKLGAQGQGQEAAMGGTKVLMFSGNKMENVGISLDRSENLFEKVSVRYSKLERRML
jgi:hypothetical protein